MLLFDAGNLERVASRALSQPTALEIEDIAALRLGHELLHLVVMVHADTGYDIDYQRRP